MQNQEILQSGSITINSNHIAIQTAPSPQTKENNGGVELNIKIGEAEGSSYVMGITEIWEMVDIDGEITIEIASNPYNANVYIDYEGEKVINQQENNSTD